MRPTRARLIALLVLAAALAGVPLLPTFGAAERDPSAAAAERTVTVTPATGMQAGQVVKVRWTGFRPGSAYLHQCTNGAIRWSQCAEVTRVVAQTGLDGTGEVDFTVWRASPIPTPPNVVGGTNFQISCNATNPCAIFVSECGFGLSGHSASVPVNFGPGGAGNPTPTTAPPLSTTTTTIPSPEPSEKELITAMAPSSALRFIDETQFAVLEKPELGLNLDITRQNSPNANTAFATGSVDFAISSLGLNETELSQLAADGRDVAYVPIAVSALTLPIELRVNGLRATEMNLSAATIAAIYNGQTSSWNDPRVVADNDGCSIEINGRRYPVASFRTDTSGANWLFSAWLDTRAKDEWGLGVDSRLPIIDSQTYGRLGAEELAKFITQGDSAIDHASNSGAGRFGFVDRSWARAWGAPTARLKNAAGQYVSGDDDAAILRTIEATGVDASAVFVPDFNSTVPDTYPLPVVYYALVQTNLDSKLTAAKAQNVKDYLTFLVSAEGQDMAAGQGFVRLPASLETIADDAIAQIGTTGGNGTTTTTTTSVVQGLVTTPGSEFSSGLPDSGFGDSTGFGNSASNLTPSALDSDFGAGELSSGEVTIAEENDETGPIAAVRRLLGNAAAMIALPAVLGLGVAAVVGGQILKRSRANELT